MMYYPIKLQFYIMMTILSALTASAQGLELGSVPPALTVTDDSGQTLDLGAALGTGTAVVFFYPMASTPGCTKQACSLGKGWPELRSRGVKVFGVSGDGVAAQNKFKTKYSLPYPLIADKDLRVNKAFAKKRFSRQVYIFHEGKLVWRDLSAATRRQFEEVIAALDSLKIAKSAE
jgi:peroxiredoxin Q/BCP